METILNRIGMLIGLMGILLCLVAGIGRISGHYYLFDYQLITLLFAGIGMMVASCMLKLYSNAFKQ